MTSDSGTSTVTLPKKLSDWEKLRRSVRERRVPVRLKRLVPDTIGRLTHQKVVYSPGGRKRFLRFRLEGMTRASEILDEVFNAEIYFPVLDKRTKFEIKSGDTVIDIGANIGLFATAAANASATGRVYCFEPSRENFERLEYHRRRNGLDNMVLVNKAVSDREETVKLYVMAENCGAHTTVPDRGDGLYFSSEEYELVECVPLQRVFDDNVIERCNFLKIDCEGAEMKILSGLPAEYFRRIDKIALEYHANVDVIELAELLYSHGYTVAIKGFPVKWGMVFAIRQ